MMVKLDLPYVPRFAPSPTKAKFLTKQPGGYDLVNNFGEIE